MNKQWTRRQRGSFFLINFLTFALIFLLLGFIILQLLNRSAYQETDQSLIEMSRDEFSINQEVQRYQGNTPMEGPMNDQAMPPTSPSSNRFNTQIILWKSDGTILNTEALGGRYSQLSDLTLQTKNLNEIESVTVTASEETLNFHSITLEYNSSSDDISYIQILSNVNQIEHSLQTSRTIVILSMITFWLLSIIASYVLASFSMRPLLKAWDKQQEFVENASHELRTPLAIIQNDLQKLFRHPDQTIIDQSETIAQAMKETRRLTGLTDDLLTIARGDSNRLVIEKETVDLAPFFKDIVTPFEEMAGFEEKQFDLKITGTKTFFADPQKIHQVLVILLDNALKYTQKGDTIRVLSQSNDKKWEVHVQNTGPNIPKKDQPYVFDRFYREDKSRAKETGGYGLGLSIAKQLIVEHGGSLTVQDLNPTGVDFIFQLKQNK